MSEVDREVSSGLGNVWWMDDSRADVGWTGDVMAAVADGLNAHDLDVLDPASKSSRYLYVVNARDAFSEIIIGKDGNASWEYRPFSRSRHGVAQIAGMVLDILNVRADCRAKLIRRRPGRSLNEAVGRVLQQRGMCVRLAEIGYEDDRGVGHAEIIVTNPSHGGRGHARVSDDGTIWWRCQLTPPDAGTPALSPDDFASAIATAIARAEGR